MPQIERFFSTKSNVASTLLLVWTGLNALLGSIENLGIKNAALSRMSGVVFAIVSAIVAARRRLDR